MAQILPRNHLILRLLIQLLIWEVLYRFQEWDRLLSFRIVCVGVNQ